MSSSTAPLSRRRSRATMRILSLLICSRVSFGFLAPGTILTSTSRSSYVRIPTASTAGDHPFSGNSHGTLTTALNVWWFGGTEQNEVGSNDESCELVAVRIEKTSVNSRRIAGEIIVPAKLEDVWSILTDYDRLSIHVPNLMESRIIQRNSKGEPADGKFRCRLFQKGAQKIIGFDFSASVTMDMTESIIPIASKMAAPTGDVSLLPEARAIGFKCVESQFFSEFDGEWKVKEQIAADGDVETVCSYTVDVRPKGPVPVAALEWRIREDVPTNLRAVKAATMRINAPNTLPLANSRAVATNGAQRTSVMSRTASNRRAEPIMVPAMSDWDRDETMAKYL